MIARQLSGRSRILTDEVEINRDNVLDVLYKAFEVHRQNQMDIQYLLDYKGGDQPLLREKLIRPEIDISNIINAAEYVTWFHTAYFWSQPPLLVQRSDMEVPEQNAEMDDSGYQWRLFCEYLYVRSSLFFLRLSECSRKQEDDGSLIF